MWINEYESRLFRNPAAIDFYMTTGAEGAPRPAVCPIN
jgi:hypothetical protein